MRPSRILILATLLAGLSAGPAFTQQSGPAKQDPPAAASGDRDAATKSAIQSVVKAQLDAFDHENAQAAESFAAPSIQERFPKPSEFLDMVKEHYAALIHPKSTAFGEMATSPHGPLQTMTIVASDGTVWTAIYSFEQVDGGWRITGCGLEKLAGQQDI